jgi:hypothetical protein
MKHNTEPSIDSNLLNFKSSVSAWRITRFLLYTVGILIILSLLGHGVIYLLPDFLGRDVVAGKFALNEEQTFPTLYSSIALFFSGVLFWVIAQHKKRFKDQYTFSWQALSGIFTYLAIDELLSLHEHLSKPMHQLGANGILHNAWVIPGVILVAIFCMIFYRFFQHLPRYMKRLMLLAFAIFIGGAIVTEIIGGYYKYLYGEENLGYALITTVEESMEMLGIVVLIHALLLYMTNSGINSININFNMTQNANKNRV